MEDSARFIQVVVKFVLRYYGDVFEYNPNFIFALLLLTMRNEISSRFNELAFHPRLKILI